MGTVFSYILENHNNPNMHYNCCFKRKKEKYFFKYDIDSFFDPIPLDPIPLDPTPLDYREN